MNLVGALECLDKPVTRKDLARFVRRLTHPMVRERS
jgi:hypothetical protein